MASINFYLLCVIALCALFASTFPSKVSAQIKTGYPFTCSRSILTCNSLLYQENNLTVPNIGAFYSVNTSKIAPITHQKKQDYLVSVPCSCKAVNGTLGYFYDTSYNVRPNDTFFNVSNQFYSGQAFDDGKEFIAGEKAIIHLLCGCLENGESSNEVVVTYTVQEQDTLLSIAELLSSRVEEIVALNKNLAANPNLLDVGFVLYVPMKINNTGPVTKGRN